MKNVYQKTSNISALSEEDPHYVNYCHFYFVKKREDHPLLKVTMDQRYYQQQQQQAQAQNRNGEINFSDVLSKLSPEDLPVQVDEKANDLLNIFVQDYLDQFLEGAAKIADEMGKNEIDDTVIKNLMAASSQVGTRGILTNTVVKLVEQQNQQQLKQLNPQQKAQYLNQQTSAYLAQIVNPPPLPPHEERMKKIRQFREAKKSGNM